MLLSVLKLNKKVKLPGVIQRLHALQFGLEHSQQGQVTGGSLSPDQRSLQHGGKHVHQLQEREAGAGSCTLEQSQDRGDPQSL